MDTNLKASPAAGTTVRTNQVSLLSSNITNVQYIEGTMEVTYGQPVQGLPTPAQISGGWQVTLKCGRQSNAGVAQDFKNLCGGSSNMFGLDTNFDSTPINLNFYFGVDITFSGQSSAVTVYLGQGHVILTGANNWWIGGPAVNNSNGAVTLTLPDGTTVNINPGNDDHSFQFV